MRIQPILSARGCGCRKPLTSQAKRAEPRASGGRGGLPHTVPGNHVERRRSGDPDSSACGGSVGSFGNEFRHHRDRSGVGIDVFTTEFGGHTAHYCEGHSWEFPDQMSSNGYRRSLSTPFTSGLENRPHSHVRPNAISEHPAYVYIKVRASGRPLACSRCHRCISVGACRLS